LELSKITARPEKNRIKFKKKNPKLCYIEEETERNKRNKDLPTKQNFRTGNYNEIISYNFKQQIQ